MTTARRPYGTGTLYQKAGAWYGRWLVGGRRTNRKLGQVRQPGTKEGLTRSQAERELRRRVESEAPQAVAQRLTVSAAADRYVHHLEHVVGRKPSTVQDYRIMIARHLEPHFGDAPLDRIGADQVRAYIQSKTRDGYARQSILNQLNFLSGVFRHAVQRGWAASNPVAAVEKPRSDGRDGDVRSGSGRGRGGDPRGARRRLRGHDRALYLTAAMTGLRQGELIGLRWLDVDWTARRLRVRQTRVRGRLGTPKSRRGSRAVPLADRVARELELHFQRSGYQDDEDLVFPHPQTGHPLDPSRLLRRFKKALRAAGVREVRFHDLRHTFGTRMAAAGVPLRTLQEWMGHRDFATTLVYADYQPDDRREAELVERAFDGLGTVSGTELSETESTSHDLRALHRAEYEPPERGL
jgi:integrase